MFDAETKRITKTGTVTVTKSGISVDGFDGSNMSCREMAIIACAWAIGELQREMLRTIEQPGGGHISVD